jgi:hypothetical protein
VNIQCPTCLKTLRDAFDCPCNDCDGLGYVESEKSADFASMSHFWKRGLLMLAAVSLLLVVVSRSANALSTEVFDHWAKDDQNRYIKNLALGTAKALYTRGDVKGGDLLVKLMNDGGTTGGGAQFFKCLNEIRVINLQNSQANNPKRYDVEYAMALLLKNNGIAPLTITTLTAINENFKPLK